MRSGALLGGFLEALNLACSYPQQEKHIDELGSKIVQYASIFRKVRDLLPTNCLQSLFNSFIQSRIDYAIEIYGDGNKKAIQRIQVHQNRMLKILQFKRRLASTNEIHEKFNVLKISDQYEFKILKLMHSYVNSKENQPDAFHNLFEQGHPFTAIEQGTKIYLKF